METPVTQLQVERVVGLVLGWNGVHAERSHGDARWWKVRARDVDGRPVRTVLDEGEIRRAIASLMQVAAPLRQAA